MKKLLSIFLLLFTNLSAEDFKLEKIVQGFDSPWSLTFIDNQNLLVTEKPGNIKFINDSKATNFHAVTNAINRSKNIILILHGLTKNIPSEELKLTSDVKKIIVQSEMKLNLNQFYGKIIKYESINEIKNLIKSEMQEGDTVLFSCGGASFNDFKNYKERGNFFKKLVNEIDSET